MDGYRENAIEKIKGNKEILFVKIFFHTSKGENKRCQTCFTRSLSPPFLPLGCARECVCVCLCV